MNRVLTGRIASYHFAPTELNKSNLEHDNITENIFVTGNTAIDAFKTTVRKKYVFHNQILNDVPFFHNRVILVTAHRRENLGQPLVNICAEKFEDAAVVYPVHPNPAVRD